MVRMEVEQAETARSLDEVRYSRVIHTLGREGVEALRRSRILIIGCGGVGAEIAKNVILCGVASVGLVDDGAVRTADLGATFLLSQGDVGQNRALSTVNALKDLNPDASVEALPCSDIEVHLKKFSVVVATDGTVPFLVKLNHLCRSSGIAFVYARARGVFASVFCDFGDHFLVRDDTGTTPFNVVIESITQDFPATVTVVEEQRHGLQDRDAVVFHGIRGMEELNRSLPVAVNVTGSHSFTILVDTRQFGRYTSGGYFHKVKASKTVKFLPLEEALVAPQFCAYDPAKQQHILDLHVAFQAVETFERIKCPDSHFVNPVAIKDEEIDEVLLLARQAAALISMPMTNDCTPITSGFGDERWHSTSSNYKIETDVDDKAYGDMVNGQTKDKKTLTGEQIAEANKNACPVKTQAEVNENIVKLVALEAHVELCPIVCIAGGIAAQEVIKAVTGVFFPVHQWLYIDAIECLPPVAPSFQERSASDSRYDSYVAIFGKDLQKKLGHGQWLVVGAGAIGCEVMKNLVLMGIGCSPNGSITVSDMDNVSKPNLSNQVLYQIDDLGRLKTASASRVLRKINPAAQVRALNVKFSMEAENIFDSSFFDSICGVLSALDTSSSRLYLDARCVAYQKPMIDGGKHGTRGSVQVFVPFCSEMYASTRDPPEHRESPICTIKNFPYASEHTLQWAVELFENLFKQRPDDVNAYLSNRDFQESLKMSTTPARHQILEMLRDALVKYKPLSFEACIEWARLQFEEMFSNNIKQLCYNFPIDMRTTAGASFWSGTKRLPRALDFDPEDPLHMDFVIAAANLQATVYGLRGCTDHNHFMQILQKIDIPVFKPKEGVKIALSDNDLPSSTQGKASTTVGDCDVASSSDILSQLPTPTTLVGYRLSPVNFDKDDEGNFHAEFVHSAANLRSQNYGIGYSDKLQARLIGGRTIPSIITTASVVGGLMCLEVFKILQEKPLEEYRHSYFNLSLPLFISAQPIKAVENKVIRTQKEPLLWTLWDKFEMDCVGMSLQTFIAEFKQEHGLDVNMIMYGKSLLYAEFLNKKKLQERMSLTLLELVLNVGKVTIPTTENKLILSLTCTDADDLDVEVPDVIIKVR
ncbi:hypothetical protein SUGI_0515000 [Cryptomeria japonica]|uniref:uncharacterized protein LOC131049864 isoform X1 n=1 Tax=Cryptomeria japonica TaxID=3369 RepID=UPI002408D9EB|nr:uncharacterized protein LOC131049864 isoform X1 [Cryptomeria japonica]GLJ26570.1 hypothetical protein SUGI_0515000 [Cryptomeria japonica]